MGKTRTLIVTQCFENQLASVQTFSQIHLNLIETRALEFQPSGHAQGPEAHAPCTEAEPRGVAGMCMGPTAAFSWRECELTTGFMVSATFQPVPRALPPW